MIIAIGIDSVEVSRIEKTMERWGERFLRRVFSAEEIEYCRTRHYPPQHYGARFAAKEACMKCLGRGILGGMGFGDIEAVRDADGKIRLALHGRAKELFEKKEAASLHVSLTHTTETATAIVVMEAKTPGDDS
ncbi:MAG: holo-ACP synthase [Syntrophales bacterium]|nr:holo-ACP synthase [Syntrophales bacterium]